MMCYYPDGIIDLWRAEGGIGVGEKICLDTVGGMKR